MKNSAIPFCCTILHNKRAGNLTTCVLSPTSFAIGYHKLLVILKPQRQIRFPISLLLFDWRKMAVLPAKLCLSTTDS